MELTLAGQQAEQIARWAWDDPQARAQEGLSRVTALARSASDPEELSQVSDVVAMLTRLAGTVPAQLASEDGGLDCSISSQLDLASIAGHHIKGTDYTFRHGWIPVIGQLLNDKYPEYLVKKDQEKDELAKAKEELAQGGRDIKAGKGKPAPQVAGKRQLTPDQQAMLAEHKKQMGRASQATARALAPSTPRVTPAAKLPNRAEMQAESLSGIHSPAAPPPSKGAAAAAAAAVFEANPQATKLAEERADATLAAAKASAAAPPSDFKEGTYGAALAKSDPGLASLAAPGASMAAMKAYIDARVATEVARQMKQITDKQKQEIDQKFAKVHVGQQRLIAHIRKTVQTADDQTSHQDHTHLVAYNLFNLAGLGITIGGLASGMNPILAAMAAFAVPLATTIHDYVRSM